MQVCESLANGGIGCNWISYSQEKELCLFLETCTLDSTNEEFVSAHESCGAPKISKTYTANYK